MRINYSPVVSLLLILSMFACSPQKESKVLVFSKTSGFRHGSIETGQKAIEKLGKENGFSVTITENPEYFNEDSLKAYSAVIFLNTTGDILDYYQQADFERYIQAGGGYVGIHSATDTEYEWPWYGKLVGAYFKGHPRVQEATLNVINKSHPSTSMLPDEWVRSDEWYNFRDINPNLNILIKIDESSYEGGTNDGDHPMAWYHDYDGGQVFYTEFGHTNESFVEPLFLQHLLGGIQYAIGNDKRDYSKATSDRVPLETRFVRTVLAQNLYEPMELEYLPNDKILFIERVGNVKVYDLSTEELTTVSKIEVETKGENGLLGMAIDPDFETNKWIYLYYSPLKGESIQQLSRFEFNGEINLASEKVLLTIPNIRDCCHSGGSLEFGPGGLLYLSAGDDTNPFESSGYSPSDEQEGRALWDAQKSSANTNDLRGKILRIKPEDDGTYSIPEGNLFPVGTEKTRPEIFTMGLRNPFRISVDQKTGFLYWGDVGPDAGKNDETRGPKGIDELNQARKAGNYGWPYTRGNNQAYIKYDFKNKKPLKPFDPNNLVNTSPNNTGLANLPPAQKSLVWYGYDESKEFPWVKTGGKNPMAGPIYYSDQFSNIESRFPDYFNGKILFYEWIRDWIYVITLDENHDFKKAEPFMANSRFNNPTDMIYGRDGNLYILEYGEKWTTQNLDARLNKIEFVRGNRAPIARIESDKIVGAVPLTVSFSADQSEDLERDPITYQWFFDKSEVQSTDQNVAYTFDKPGIYKVKLTVKDKQGEESSTMHEIIAGNASPEVKIELNADIPYYTKNGKAKYKVVVKDTEDGSTLDGTINSSAVKISYTYLSEGKDFVQATVGHQVNLGSKGKALIDGSDCMACHRIDEKLVGPSYLDVSKKYTEKDKEYLTNKIMNGGSGVWGNAPMAAHPTLKKEDVKEMVDYILSIKEEPNTSLPLEGTVSFDQHKPTENYGLYVITATYTDKGNGDITALTSQDQIVVKSPYFEAEDADDISKDVSAWNAGGDRLLGSINHGKYFGFKDVKLGGLKSVDFSVFYAGKYEYAGKVYVKKGGADGVILGEMKLGIAKKDKGEKKTYSIAVKSSSEDDDLYFVFENNNDKGQFITNANGIYLNY